MATVREIQGYCLQCKAPRKMLEVRYLRTGSGRPAAQGKCQLCGSRMFKYVKEGEVPPGAIT